MFTSIVILPRTHIHTTTWGRKFWFDRRVGLLTQDPYSLEVSRISADQMRRGWPNAHRDWVRFARLLPPEEAALAAEMNGRAIR